MNLKQLFEYQHFAENPELAAMIRDTQSRYPAHRAELSDEDVLQIAAAGMPELAAVVEAENLSIGAGHNFSKEK